MNDILFNLLKAVLVASISAIIRYVIPWLKEKYQYSIVLKAVQAAEQQYKELSGPEKRDKVLAYAADRLNKFGLKITEEQLRILLEAAVYEVNRNKQQQ